MKVLAISHSSDLAGAEMSMLDLFDYWSKTTDIEVELIIREPKGRLTVELNKRTWKYYSLDYTNWAQINTPRNPLDIYWNAKRNKKALGGIERIMRASKPDLVITNTIVAPWAAMAANKLGLPHVWFVREYAEEDSGFDFVTSRDRIFTDIGKLSDLVVTNSLALMKAIRPLIGSTPTMATYTPFDISAINRRALQVINNPFKDTGSMRLVVVGRISRTKGQYIAAEAAGMLITKGYNIELCLVGAPAAKGDDRELNQVIEKYGIEDRVIMVGQQDNQLPYVRMSDLAIAPSQNEAFGRTTFEYMALGKPVIGADSGATPELIINGKNGWLYKQNDPNELAEIIEKHYQERKSLLGYGKNSKEAAKAMMNGGHGAGVLYKRLSDLVGKHKERKPYNADWLDNLLLPPKYIRRGGLGVLPNYVLLKTKHLLKTIYLKIN